MDQFLIDNLFTILQLIVSGLLLGGVYALISSGFSLVYGVMRVGNAAHASMSMLGAFITWELLTRFNLDPIYSIGIVFVIIAIINIPLLKGLVIRMVREELLSYVMLYGIGIVISNTLLLVYGGIPKMVSPPYAGLAYDFFGLKFSIIRVISSLSAIIILGILFLFLSRTFFGKAISAVAQSKKGAELVGVNLDSVYLVTFAISAGLGGAGGVLLSQIYPFQPGGAVTWMNKVMAITIFGGLGDVRGTLLAAMVLGVGELAIFYFFNPIYITIFSYSLLILTFIVRPWGILGREYREK